MNGLPSSFLVDRRLLARFDWVLFFISLLIATLGILNIYSAGSSGDITGGLYKKQIYWLLVGVLLLFLGAFIKHSYLEQYGYAFYIISIFLLILVLFQGRAVSGSQRWIRLWGFNVQPSEIVKISLLLVLAKWFHRKSYPKGYGLISLFIPFVFVFFPFFLIFLQPDLGTALMLLVLFFSIALLVKVQLGFLLFLFFFSLGVLPFSWNLLKDYQKERVVGFLNPHVDPLGKGYQVIQSKIAIGSGKLFGKGFLKGTQTQLDFIPEKYTDFVFSVFCEEWGFLGAMVLLFLYCLLFVRFLSIASNARNSFGMILGYGITALFFWQFLINLGMVLGLLPTVGITLPLFSYGGSSLAISLFSIGILINIHIQRHIF